MECDKCSHLMIMKTCFLLLLTLFMSSQQSSVKTYTIYAEVMPEYPGGEGKLMNFIYSNLRYPDWSYEHHIQGRSVVSFTVMANGKVDSVHIVRGMASDLDQEALRVVRMLDNFKPGILSGKPIPIRYTLPIMFRIDTVHPDSRSVPHPSYR